MSALPLCLSLQCVCSLQYVLTDVQYITSNYKQPLCKQQLNVCFLFSLDNKCRDVFAVCVLKGELSEPYGDFVSLAFRVPLQRERMMLMGCFILEESILRLDL